MSAAFVATIVLIIVIVWVYLMQYSTLSVAIRKWKDIAFKTGDMILFKAYDNYNSVFHGSYFGHVGLVFMHDNIPYLFEANAKNIYTGVLSADGEGVYVSRLWDRIANYKGRAYYRGLVRGLDALQLRLFSEFVSFSLANLYYDHAVILNGLRKYVGAKKCDFGSDCGQIVFLTYIKVGLLPESDYDLPIMHHLLYVTQLGKLLCGNSLGDICEICIV